MGEMEFTKESIVETKELHLAFFERYLKGADAGFSNPKAKVYVTGTNVWREFNEFPPAQVKNASLYLHSNRNANTINGDGQLTWNKPIKANPDTFTFDPQNPIRSRFSYAVDCREIEKRQDVLVYTSEVLEKPVEIIGEVSVYLYASSDGFDTDFTARLIDVYPDGRATNLGADPVGGIIRARYRNGYDKEVLLEPNKPELFRIKLFYMGHTFLVGHKIRVEISSSATPDYFPNQNTGNPVATDTEWKIVHQTVYHDSTRPSHIVLPIMTSNK
jgi:putative CocE/NonD family hydrolase